MIVSTAVGSDVLAGLVPGLTPHGRPTVAGFDATAVRLPMADLVMHARTGHLTGSTTAIEQAVRCTVTTGVRPRVRTLPLQRAGQGLKAQQTGEARFRIVLTTPTA
ncbi:hypothetical protein [Streptomyces sp. NPDC088801]|uniref:hypothetical protein n=1 Tax=Streptomyces sp. NPDC088801 TaxID=3365903 RepID=UPI003800D2FD